jgi:hypothetical protein
MTTATAAKAESTQRNPWTVESALAMAATRTKENARAPDSAAHFLLDRVETGTADAALIEKIKTALLSAKSIGEAVRKRPGFKALGLADGF